MSTSTRGARDAIIYAAAVATALEDVSLQASDPSVAKAVVGPVLLALGARAGLDVGRLDELAIALDIAIGSAVPGPVTTHLRRNGGSVRVTVSPIARDRLEGRRGLLERLPASVAADGDALALTLDA
jgi:hypothetical protein